MTINIPLKAVAFIAYTLALLGGAFGISYGVHEWRDDGAATVVQPLPRQGATLDERNAERELQLCEAVLEAVGNVSSGGVLELEISERLDRYCFVRE